MKKLKQQIHAFWKLLAKSRKNHLLIWLKREKYRILLITMMQMLLAGISVCFSLSSKGIIDGAVAGQRAVILRYAGVLILLLLGEVIFHAGIMNLTAKSRGLLTNRIRQELLEAMLRKKYEKVGAYHSGELTNRMFSDVNVVVNGLLNIAPPLASMITRLAAASIILFRINWRFTGSLFAVGMGMLMGSLLLKNKMKSLHKQVQAAEGKVHSVLQETLVNLRIVKASGSEDYLLEKVDSAQNSHYAAQMERKNFSILANIGMGVAFDACWIYTIVWGCFRIADGIISYGTLTAMMQLVGQIQAPFAGMTGIVQNIYSVMASAERLEEIFALPEEAEIKETPELPENYYEKLQGISFENLEFSYGRNQVLERINGNVQKGDCVAITGLSGGGKSTLFLLLLGIYEPVSGRISFLFNGDRETASRKMRALFAYVPQGNALFSGTIRENLVMFHPQTEDKALWAAAEAACIDGFIRELPEGMETTIGERGLGLSEGQAQRIAIARAILSEAPIFLLDEATSALDEETEASVLKNLSQIQNKTCFIVTHRKAALGICNKELKIKDGSGEIQIRAV